MPHITIISSSIREGRSSHRVALFFKAFILDKGLATVEIIDLQQENFPLFTERLKFQKEPAQATLAFSKKIAETDGVLIVTPEYNGGYPASLKNVIDLLNEEWIRKPVAISTVSSGMFGGSQVITSLQFSLWKLKAWTVPAMFPVAKVNESYDEQGVPSDPSAYKRAESFVNELLWCVKANELMKREA